LPLHHAKKNTTTTSNSGTSNPTNNNIYPSNATNFYGFLSFTKNQNINLSPNPHIVYTNYNAEAVFDSTLQPFNAYNVPHFTVDSVFINNTVCPLNTSNTSYSTFGLPDSLCTWRVVGNNTIHSFNFTKNNGMAIYTNYNLLPDTIDHTQPITFPIHLTNADDVVVILNVNGTGPIQTLTPGATSISFSAASMSGGHTGMGSILIQNSNYYAENVYGKPMQFAFFLYFEKQVYFK
jgi:hypothetical protein